MSSRGKLWGCQIFREDGLPRGWEYVPVDDLLDLEYGAALSEEKRMPGPIPVYGSSGVVGSHNKAFVRGPGIVVGRKGTIGAVTYVPTDFWPIDTTYWVRPKRGGNMRYLEALLDYLKLGRLNAATGVPGLSRRDAIALSVFLAAPDEQAAIARILDATDTAIERARVAVEKAERVKTSLLQRVFGDSSSPRRISEFCKDACYGTSQASNDRGWGYPTLRIPNVIGGDFNSSNLTFVDMGEASAKSLALESGDALVVRTNGNPAYVGRAAVFYPPDGRIWLFASYLIRLRFSADLSPDYFQEFINSSFGRRELHQRVATSAGNYNLNIRNLRSIRIPWIEPDMQTQAVKLLRAANQTIRATETRVTCLERLKRGLMQDLLTGRVRVKAAAAALAATI